MRIDEFSKESRSAENGILKSYSTGEKSRGSMTWEGKMNSRKVGCRWREGVFWCRGKSSWQCQRSVRRGWPCRAWVRNSIKAAWLVHLQCTVDVKVGSEPGEGTFQGENLEALYWQLQCLRQRLWPYPASSIILLVWVQLLFQWGLPLSGAFLILLPDALLASQPHFLTSLISLLLSLNSGDLQLWKIDILLHNWEKGVSVIALWPPILGDWIDLTYWGLCWGWKTLPPFLNLNYLHFCPSLIISPLSMISTASRFTSCWS